MRQKTKPINKKVYETITRVCKWRISGTQPKLLEARWQDNRKQVQRLYNRQRVSLQKMLCLY